MNLHNWMSLPPPRCKRRVFEVSAGRGYFAFTLSHRFSRKCTKAVELVQQGTRVLAQRFGQEIENISHLKAKNIHRSKNKSEKWVCLLQKALTPELIVLLILKID